MLLVQSKRLRQYMPQLYISIQWSGPIHIVKYKKVYVLQIGRLSERDFRDF